MALAATAVLGLASAAPARAAVTDDESPDLAPLCVRAFEEWDWLVRHFVVARNDCLHPVRVRIIVSLGRDSDCESLDPGDPDEPRDNPAIRHQTPYWAGITRVENC